MRTMLLALAAVLVVGVQSISFGRTQSVAVRGRLLCDEVAAVNIVVKLYDEDSGIDLDDLMDQTKSNQTGYFELKGHTSEFTTIDPKFNIYHDCQDGVTPCQKKFTIFIPDSFVSNGEHPEKTFDAGVIQLAGTYPGQSRDCLH